MGIFCCFIKVKAYMPHNPSLVLRHKCGYSWKFSVIIHPGWKCKWKGHGGGNKIQYFWWIKPVTEAGFQNSAVFPVPVWNLFDWIFQIIHNSIYRLLTSWLDWYSIWKFIPGEKTYCDRKIQGRKLHSRILSLCWKTSASHPKRGFILRFGAQG